MNKPITLCDRCKEYARCCLNYDGYNCRRSRTVEPTNADRIRAMSDEELAEFLYNVWKEQDTFSKEVCESCGDTDIGCRPNCWLDWLRKEEESDGEDG